MRPGARRSELDATLRAAYAEGLLSADTFVERAAVLLGAGAVVPDRVVGDVTLRRRRSDRRLVAGVRRWVARLEHRCVVAETLLGLDWSGATETLLVGRGVECDVQLDDPTVSRRHARLRFRDGAWIVQDLDSRNGTSLNGVAVGRGRIVPGDRLAFAEVRLRVD